MNKKIIFGFFILSIANISLILSIKMNTKSKYATPNSRLGTKVNVIKSFNENAVGTSILTTRDLEASRRSRINLNANAMAAINKVSGSKTGNEGNKIISNQIGTFIA